MDRELQAWVLKTKYQLTDQEKRPLWKVHNLSVLAGTAVGVVSYFGIKRLKIAPMISPWIPASLLFFGAFRTAQQSQRPALYEKLLRMDTPLGEQYAFLFQQSPSLILNFHMIHYTFNILFRILKRLQESMIFIYSVSNYNWSCRCKNRTRAFLHHVRGGPAPGQNYAPPGSGGLPPPGMLVFLLFVIVHFVFIISQ